MATSFSGGGSRSTRREPPTMGKQLVNFITCGCESSAHFIVLYKPGANPGRIGDRLVWVVRSQWPKSLSQPGFELAYKVINGIIQQCIISSLSEVKKKLCNQCLSILMFWDLIPLREGALDTTLCDKVCQSLATGRWFSPDIPLFSTNKTDRHDITEILLKIVLNTVLT